MKKSGLIIAALGLAFSAAPALASMELATKSACTQSFWNHIGLFASPPSRSGRNQPPRGV